MKIKLCILRHLPRNINSWPFLNYFEPTLSVSPPPPDFDFFVASEIGRWPLFFLAFHRLRRRNFSSKNLQCPVLPHLKWVDSHALEKLEISRNRVNDTTWESAFSWPGFGPFFHSHSPFQSVLIMNWSQKISAVCSPRRWNCRTKTYLCLPPQLRSSPLLWHWVEQKGWGMTDHCFKTLGIWVSFVTRHRPNGFGW